MMIAALFLIDFILLAYSWRLFQRSSARIASGRKWRDR